MSDDTVAPILFPAVRRKKVTAAFDGGRIAGRVTETATRVRIAFAAACPEAELFRGIASSLQPAGP